MEEDQQRNSSNSYSDHVTLDIEDVHQVLNVTFKTEQEDQNE